MCVYLCYLCPIFRYQNVNPLNSYLYVMFSNPIRTYVITHTNASVVMVGNKLADQRSNRRRGGLCSLHVNALANSMNTTILSSAMGKM